ncbi:hypothetical protein [Agaribacterium haliotis]|nr:hypothetical protein [Agaribacterium haliotis]
MLGPDSLLAALLEQINKDFDFCRQVFSVGIHRIDADRVELLIFEYGH